MTPVTKARPPLAVAAVLALTVTACSGSSGSSPSPGLSPSASATTTAAPVGSSGLALSADVVADPGWVASMREQVARAVKTKGSAYRLEAPAVVDVTAFGDVGKIRYAAASYPTRRGGAGRKYWNRSIFIGPAGADADEMKVAYAKRTGDLSRDPIGLFAVYADPDQGGAGGAVVVNAPAATEVSVPAATEDLTYDGTSTWTAEITVGKTINANFTSDGATDFSDTIAVDWPMTDH